jgi:hypothetical protein
VLNVLAWKVSEGGSEGWKWVRWKVRSVAWSDMFERFLDTKYSGAKRFGLEGVGVMRG